MTSAPPPRAPRFAVVPAVYLVLVRQGAAGPEVLLQQRSGTPFMSGWWACAAAGHVERGESALQAAVREAREEIGVGVDPGELSLLATLHRTCALPDPLEQRVDLFLTLRRWDGQPRVAEPEKSAGLAWFPLEDLPERVVPHERQALEHLRDGGHPALLTRGFGQSLTLVAAKGRNDVIGDGTAMPWHLPEDLRHFKTTTMGGTLLMGRRTYDSIGRALPGRTTIVVTRDREWTAPGVVVTHSLAEALHVAGDTEVFVAGGGEIYEQTIEHAHRLVITEVDLEPAGEVRFPPIDPATWHEVSREPREGLTFVRYERRGVGS